jgi:D-serine deaminase-like pyridoxal phosphate-dependent protein
LFDVLIEVDTDGHRSGIRPDDPALLDVGYVPRAGGMRLAGVLTHAGSSYELNTPEALTALAEQERRRDLQHRHQAAMYRLASDT